MSFGNLSACQCVFLLNIFFKGKQNVSSAFPISHPWFSFSRSASLFFLIIFWCVFSSLPVSPGYQCFQSLEKNDSSLSLLHLPTRWLQLLLTNCQAESAPEISPFPSPLPGFIPPHMAPSVRDLFMPHLLVPMSFIFPSLLPTQSLHLGTKQVLDSSA